MLRPLPPFNLRPAKTDPAPKRAVHTLPEEELAEDLERLANPRPVSRTIKRRLPMPR